MITWNFRRLLYALARQPAGLALAVSVVTVSTGMAAPLQAALVESVTGASARVEVMDYVEAGQTIRLGPQDTVVLRYLESCVRETITGGTVTVGTDQSEVKAGRVTRTKDDCGGGRFVLTGRGDIQVAGRALRGLAPAETSPQK